MGSLLADAVEGGMAGEVSIMVATGEYGGGQGGHYGPRERNFAHDQPQTGDTRTTTGTHPPAHEDERGRKGAKRQMSRQ